MEKGKKKVYLFCLIMFVSFTFLTILTLVEDKYSVKKELETSNEDSIVYYETGKDKKLSRNDLSNLSLEEKNNIVYLMNNYFNNVYNVHSDNYCGELNKKESLLVDRVNEYLRVVGYDNYDDMVKYLEGIVSDSYISKNLKKSFAQNNDKLYCRCDQNEMLDYIKNSFELDGVLKEKNKITIIGNYAATNDKKRKGNYRVYATLTTNNNNYVVNTYEEY